MVVSESKTMVFGDDDDLLVMNIDMLTANVERLISFMDNFPKQDRNSLIATTLGLLHESRLDDREAAVMGVVAMVLLREERHRVEGSGGSLDAG